MITDIPKFNNLEDIRRKNGVTMKLNDSSYIKSNHQVMIQQE